MDFYKTSKGLNCNCQWQVWREFCVLKHLFAMHSLQILGLCQHKFSCMWMKKIKGWVPSKQKSSCNSRLVLCNLTNQANFSWTITSEMQCTKAYLFFPLMFVPKELIVLFFGQGGVAVTIVRPAGRPHTEVIWVLPFPAPIWTAPFVCISWKNMTEWYKVLCLWVNFFEDKFLTNSQIEWNFSIKGTLGWDWEMMSLIERCPDCRGQI
jgi:hypothetical protein